MNRNELKQISKIRQIEAKLLLKYRRYPGSYYLAGYSIECGIKACIAKKIKRYEFPNKDMVNRAWSHDLENLIGIAGLATELQNAMKTNGSLELNWAVVKDWNESSRYEINISETKAKNFYSACFDNRNNILSWIKERW